METLNLDVLKLDGGTQPRTRLNLFTIDEYAQALQEGVIFPPVVVFFDGDAYWLADGFHRVHAAMQAGLACISADVRRGTQRDAILFSVSANATHGMRRTNEDKRQAVTLLLEDAEWAQWSDREIARRTATSHVFVAKLRPVVTGNVTSERTYTTKQGTKATMSIGGALSKDEREWVVGTFFNSALINELGLSHRTYEKAREVVGYCEEQARELADAKAVIAAVKADPDGYASSLLPEEDDDVGPAALQQEARTTLQEGISCVKGMATAVSLQEYDAALDVAMALWQAAGEATLRLKAWYERRLPEADLAELAEISRQAGEIANEWAEMNLWTQRAAGKLLAELQGAA